MHFHKQNQQNQTKMDLNLVRYAVGRNAVQCGFKKMLEFFLVFS